MKLFTYRGLKIKPWMYHIRKLLYAVLLLPFVLVYAYWVYLNYTQFLQPQPNYYLIGFAVFGLFLIFLFIFILQLYLEERFLFFKKIQRLWVFSRYLLDYRYYYEKKNSNGKNKIRFPKIYLKQNRFDLEVSLEMQGNKFQDKFKDVGGSLETTFFMDFMEKNYEEKFIVYRLAYSAFLNRIHAKEVEYVEGKGIKLMNNFYWNFISDPHLLIAGGTGGGKTVLLRDLLAALLKIGTVTVYDPKRADFLILAGLPVLENRIYFMKEDIVASLERELDIMYARYEDMIQKAKELGHKDLQPFMTYGIEPHFIVADEWNSLMSSLDYNLRDRADRAITQLILQGRQVGVNVITAMQKPSADDLPTKIRSNMMLHISVGRLDRYAYDMLFGEENANKEFRFVKFVGGKRVYGRGYAAVFGEVAREFYAPLITKEFSFYDLYASYPRRENPYDPLENKASIKTYTRSESVAIINELIDDKGELVTEYIVRQIYEAMCKAKYAFKRIDDKNVLTMMDLDFMKEVFLMKQTSPLTYFEIVDYKLSDGAS